MIWIFIIAFLIFCFLYYNIETVKDAIKTKKKGEKLDEEHHDSIFNILLVIVCTLMALYTLFTNL